MRRNLYTQYFLLILVTIFAIILLLLIINPTMLEDNPLWRVLSSKDKPLWVLDAAKQNTLPKNFRTTNMPFKKLSSPAPSRQGFSKLHISGSAQFSEGEFKKLREAVGEKLFLVDLRQETHFLLNGAAISLYGYQNATNHFQSPKTIIKEENKYIKSIRNSSKFTYFIITKKKYGKIKESKPNLISVNKVTSLSEFAEQEHVNYIRFYVQDRHIPTPKEVNRFITFVNQLPEDTWIHFFCRGGKGRTTTFMTMFDILKNANNPKLSFEDITRRQTLIGGTNLFSPITQNLPPWLQKTRKERENFIQEFYNLNRRESYHTY